MPTAPPDRPAADPAPGPVVPAAVEPGPGRHRARVQRPAGPPPAQLASACLPATRISRSLAFVVWEGNRRLYYKLSRREDWLERPWYRAGLLMTVIVVFTIPVSAALLLAWQQLTGDPGLRPYAVPTAVVGIVAIAAVITNVYETVFLVRGWESARLRSARAESARLSAELDRLTREVDPHFLFNNLHALQHLVETRDQRAVPLHRSADRYLPLHARVAQWPAGVARRGVAGARASPSAGGDPVRRPDTHRDLRRPLGSAHLYLPPVSLGELLQNALKHNDVTKAHPLVLQVSLQGDVLVVANAVRPRARRSPSTGVGTEQSRGARAAVSGQTMTWGTEDGRFVVRLPLVDHADLPAEPDASAIRSHRVATTSAGVASVAATFRSQRSSTQVAQST